MIAEPLIGVPDKDKRELGVVPLEHEIPFALPIGEEQTPSAELIEQWEHVPVPAPVDFVFVTAHESERFEKAEVEEIVGEAIIPSGEGRGGQARCGTRRSKKEARALATRTTVRNKSLSGP